MKLAEKTIVELDPSRIKVFVHRARDPEAHARIIADIKNRGQVHPGQVRRIHGDKEYDFELMTGEGRLLAALKLKRPFRCFIEDEPEHAVVGAFLTENLNREALPWHFKARLVQPELAAGKSHEEIARQLSLTPGHVAKFQRILNKTAPGVESDVASMPMNEAEVFTTLPKKHQVIVMEVFRDGDIPLSELVKKAKSVSRESGDLSTTALKKSLERVDNELRHVREKMKLTRLHWSIGPQTVLALLEDPKFRAALKKEGVNFEKFERMTER